MTGTTIIGTTPPSRREFLLYIWSASLALYMVGLSGAMLWYSYPRFRAGEFGGLFSVPVGAIPPADAVPVDRPDGRFWMVSTEAGFLAIYKVCTHLGCLYKWVPTNRRFECPCHGSKFQRDGTWIEGPAPRHLDRFVVQVLDAEGELLAETQPGNANVNPAAGGPVAIPAGAALLVIDTAKRVKGATH